MQCAQSERYLPLRALGLNLVQRARCGRLYEIHTKYYEERTAAGAARGFARRATKERPILISQGGIEYLAPTHAASIHLLTLPLHVGIRRLVL